MSRPHTPRALPYGQVPSNRRPSPRPESPQSSFSGSAGTSAYSLLTPEETAQRLNSSLTHGLSPADAKARLEQYGPNELPHEEPEPLWLRFLKQFKENLIILLLISAVISFGMGNIDDAVSITIAVTIVVTVGFVQEYRSEKSLESLNRLVPQHARLVRGIPEAKRRQGRDTQDGIEMESMLDGSTVSLETASNNVLAQQLVQGDLVIFSTGDRIPADVRITSSADLAIDESNLTGENEPALKQAGVLSRHQANVGPLPYGRPQSPSYASPAAGTVGADIRLNEQVNIAFMGTLVRTGHGQGLVIATGASTEFGAISTSLRGIESPRTPLQHAMDKLGKQLSQISIAVIGMIVLVGLWQGREFVNMFQIGVSLAVAAIPEGLPIIVTVTLALGVLRMSRHNAIIRRLPSVETLGSVNVICSDKTGTLTLNHMTVTKLWHFDVDSPIDLNRGMESPSPDTVTQTILRIGNIANNARLSRDHARSPATASSAAMMSSMLGHDPNAAGAKSRWVGQPTDIAILDLLDVFGQDDVRENMGPRRAETPFSSERKWMGVVMGGNLGTDSGGGNEVSYIKGGLEQILQRCDTYLSREGREIILDEPKRQLAIAAAERMAEDGLRVLGFASGSNKEAMRLGKAPSRSGTPRPGINRTTTRQGNEEAYQGLAFAGIIGMTDPPRKDVDKSIRRLMTGGVKVIMITGDAPTTALSIAKKLGMPLSSSRAGYRPVLTGDELDRMSEDELAHVMQGTSIFARTSPDHKLKIVSALQSRGDIVAMTGDGVNDAPALKKADIGISMGIIGTDVAKEAADMILTDDDFSTILSAIEEGKGIFYNIQNFITFQLSTSVAALSLVFISTSFGLDNPLNAMQILWINILMDGPPAQSLGVEPVDPAVMNRPPRSKNAPVITSRLMKRVLTSAMIIMIGTLGIYYREMSSAGVNARDTTMTFTCFVFFDMFNALTCRSEGKSILRGELALTGNRMFNLAVGGSILGQLAVIYVPFLQRVFQTEGLSLRDLGILATLASTVFWADEIRKYVTARNARNRGLGNYSGNV